MLYYKRIEVIYMPNNIQKIINEFLTEVKEILGNRLKIELVEKYLNNLQDN